MKIDYVRLTRLLAPLAAITCALTPAQALAESGHHGAHVHGVAELTIAVEGSDLEIHFTSPGGSVLGFEHKASNNTQLAAVDDARARLRDTASLFTFTGTSCDLQSASVDMAGLDEPEAGHGSQHI